MSSIDDRYKEWKKKKNARSEGESTDSSSQTASVDDRYKAWRAQRLDLEGIANSIADRTSTWLKNHNNYLSNYNNRFSGRKGTYEDSYVADSGDWLSTVSQQRDNFEKEANSILSMLDKYGDYLDPKWTSSIRDALTSAGAQQADILKYATGDSDYWSQFASEDEYGLWQTDQGYRSKYAGKSYDEIVAAIEELDDSSEKDWLSSHKYGLLSTAEDFAENSKYKSTYRGGEKFNSWAGVYTDTGFDDIAYDYINRNETARNRQALSDIQSNAALLGLDNSERGEMTDDEIAIFNYLYATKGSDTAYAYIEELTGDLNARQRAAQEAKWAEYAKESPFGASVFSILESPMKGLSYIGQAADYFSDGTIDQNAGYNKFSYINSSIRNEVSAQVEEKWGGVGSFAYQTGMSMGDFLFTTAVSGGNQALSLAIMGTGAAADTTIAAKDRGLSDDQAFALGTVAGVAEVAMEKIGLDALFDVDTLNASVVKYIFNNALSEGFEEVGTDVINTVADIWISQDKSQWQAAINAYMSKGKTEAEAFALALGDKALELGLSFVGGAVSGGVIGGGGAAITAGVNAYNAKQTYGNYAGELVGEALEIDPSNTFAQKMQGRLDSGKKLSGGQLNRLVQQNERTLTAQDLSSIQSAATQRLTELGETGDVDAIAAALTKRFSGQKLTHKESQLIQNSQYGRRVSTEMNPENIRNGGYSSEWAENIGTERINAQEYSRMLEAAQQAQETAETTGGQVVTETQNEAQAAKTEPSNVVHAENAVTTKSVSKDGVTRQVSTGKEVTPKKIVSISGGNVMIETDSGTVSADDIEFDTMENDLLWRSAVQFNGITASGANGIVRAYRNGESVTSYLAGAGQEFRNGYYNLPSGGEMANKLTSAQREIIYELGQKAAGENIAKAQAKATADKKSSATASKTEKVGKVHFERNGRTFDGVRETALKTMEQLSAALGVEFYVFESYKNEAGKLVYKDAKGNEVPAPNGYYDPKDGSIHIDLNAGVDGKGTMLFTVAHELTHFINQWSPAKFKVLANVLMKQYAEKNVSVDDLVNNQIKKAEKNGREITWDEAYEEVVADSMEAMLTDGNVVQLMADLKQQDKTLWQKICDWFKDLVADLKAVVDAYKGYKPDSSEGRMVAQMQDIIVMLESFYADALLDAGENYQAAQAQKNTTQEGDVKLMARENMDIPYRLHQKLLNKKSISATKKDWSKVSGARVTEYRGLSDNDIPDIDFFEIAEYKEVDKGYVYTVRNYDKDSFEIIGKNRIKNRYDGYVMEVSNGKVGEDIGGRDAEEGRNGDGRTNSDRLPGYQSTLRENAGRSEKSQKFESIDDSKPGSADSGQRTVNDTIHEKFSMRETVEETKDLLAYHNITPQLLLDALNRNGLLMPSLAITNKGMTDFGDISLLFDKSTIDPTINASNKLYGADAWTPTQTELKKNAKFDTDKTVRAVNALKNRIGGKFASELFNVSPKQFKDAILKADGSIYNAYAHDLGMQTAYAMEKGIISKIPTNKDGTLNRTALQEQVSTELDTDNGWRQYKKWLRGISDDIITNYDRASNQDILNDMKSQPATAKTFKLSETGELVVPAAEYSSIDEARKNKNRLSENAEVATKAVADKFLALAKNIDRNTKAVVNAINTSFADRYSVADIVKTFNRNGIKITTETASELQSLYKQAVELPTQYFEAKPGREVSLEEIKAVVMPNDGGLSELKSKLESIGVTVVEYQSGSNASRVEALNSQENLKFSDRDSDGNQLSTEQQEYFKDSQVRDEQGRLLAMYHGTPNGGFTKFRSGTYFTQNAAYADVYQSPGASSISTKKGADAPMTYKVYLDIKKPFDTRNAKERKIFEQEFYRKYGTGTPLADSGLPDWVDGMDLQEFIEEMEYDYDGLILDEGGVGGYGDEVVSRGLSYVVFDPAQVKDVDNKKPTKDQDYRYSSRDNASYAEIEEERSKLYQREIELTKRKREAENNPDLLQAMDDFSGLFDEMKGLLSKRRAGTATQAELDRIEEIKVLREERLQRVADIQESLGLNAMSKEAEEIRAKKEALRVASDEAWAREGAERENKAIDKAGVPAAEYFRNKALKAFKTTTNFNEAGYLLPDGKLLNFSGGERNHRYRDHREIGEIYEATQGAAALNRFLNDGNIRIMAESPGIDLAAGVEPTKEQYAAIRRFVNSHGVKDRQFFVDFSDADGHRAGNYSYDGYVNADRVVNDIKYYFENGTIREQSSVASFLQSERDPELEKVNRVLEKENAQLKHDVAYLKELLKLQNQVTGGTKFTKTSVEAAAGQLMKHADAKGDRKELAGLLNGLYEYIAGSKEPTWDGVVEAAQPAVEWLKSHVRTRTERSAYANDVLKEIRNSRIYLDEQQKKEVAYQYGSYNEFRKKTMGSVILTDTATMSLDSQWHEWAAKYPNLFDTDITITNMPSALMEVFDNLRNMTATDSYGYDQELLGQELLSRVYDSYWNVSTLYTVKDKAQKEINKLKFEHAGRMATLREYHKEQTTKLKTEHREALQKVKQAERERSEKKLQEISERYQESRQKGIENRRKTEMRRKIRRTIMDLNKILNRGDKKRNVKEDMKDLVSKALKTADILFTDNYMAEDMIRNGVGTELTEQEAKYLTEAQSILAEIESAGTLQDRQEAENRLQGKLDYRMSKLKDVFAREKARLNKTKVSEVLGDLADAYASLEDSEYSYVSGAFDENVHQYLTMLKADVGGTIVKDMSLNQLDELHKAYTMVLTTVRNANKMFAANLKQTREQLGSQVIGEVKQAGGEHGLWLPGEDKLNAFSWNNQKPVYAFERIGSATLTKLFENTRAGEDSWAQDMTEAREYYLAQTKKHHYDSWNFDKQFKFTSTSGIDFSLNLEQIMSLYAYSKREQAHDHLLKGGFVFDGNTEVQVNKMGIKVTYLNKTAKAHNISPEIMGQIISKLTAEQKAFVDEMQDYLSTTMGEKGNEVSMQMYGVKLFNEKYYFPLRSAGQYMARAKEADLKKQQGQISIVNSGFTKSTTPKSSNPVVLSGFMDVWADHVNEMSMYHSFVLPMEDFRRVYNYSSPNMETGQSVSVNSVIQEAYGEAATGYIDQLYRDLNGGAVSDPRENGIKALVGKFKKAAVFASLSVVIQQPSAIGRAFAIIDPKYFIGSKVDNKRHKALWAELKKYAPVAVIKEMGYFDTGMGKSAQDFIKGKEYNTLKEKAAALFTDKDYRDEVLSKAPALADELTWCAIWEAAKRETKANNPKMDVKSEEFLQLAGKRFTEVITKTQVYDSVLSRSANMRSKGVFMSMWTAFMAEPTTTINMVEDALRKAKRGNKKYASKAIGAVTTSVVLNSLLSSLVYAMRDDDDDETFLEKYVQSFATEILDGINPLTYYPFLKDIWSSLQGFDIERSDMSLITSLVEKITKLVQVYAKDAEDRNDGDLANAWWGVADYVAAIAGVPVKNVRRDINGAINTYKTVSQDLTDRDTTWGSLVDKTWDSVKNSLPVVGWLPDETAADKLYKATVSGDTVYQKRLSSAYDTQEKLDNAIRKGLRANDSRIWEAAMAWNNNDLASYMRIAKEIIGEGHFSQDNVVMAIQAEAKAMLPNDSDSTEKAKGYFTADKFAVAISQGNDTMAATIKADIIETAQKNGKTAEEAEDSFTSSAKSSIKKLFQKGGMTGTQAAKALVDYFGISEEDAAEDVQYWTFQNKYPEYDMSESAVTDYYDYAEPAGIDVSVYYDYYTQASNCESDLDKNGNAISGSKKAKILDVIDSMELTKAQKDALYYANGWAKSTIYEAPWR